MDTSGNLRPIIQVTQNISAFDAQSIADRAPEIADAVSLAIEGKISPRLATNLRNVVRR
jgi:hypothetical protein